MTPGTRVRILIEGTWRTGTVTECPVSRGGVHVHLDGGTHGLDIDPAAVHAIQDGAA